MTDVARRTSTRRLGAQEVWQDPRERSRHETRDHRRPSANGRKVRRNRKQREQAPSVPEEPTFQLQFYAPIPSKISVGETFDAAVHISAQVPHSDVVEDALAAGQLWAVATAVTGGGRGTYLQDAAQGTLSGLQLADMVHPLDGSSRNKAAGYVSFAALSIATEGVYRMRVTLMRMSTCPTKGAEIVQSLLSDVFVVEGRI